jgi:Fe-S cluster assembly protein SufD
VHHHTAPHTHSNLDFKVVLNGRSRSAYTGNIAIEKGAPFSTAFQENRNLLLSEKARAESIPELEIDIDEVQCSHGATVGPLSRDEVFYLMSRGLPYPEAVRVIVGGFLEQILDKVPEKLREPLRGELEQKLKEL